LPKNFISQNDRGSLTFSIESHLYSGIYVPGREFCSWNLPKSSFLKMLFRRVSLQFLKKFRFECFPSLITVLCKERVIELCNKRVLIFVLLFLHESQIRSTFFSGSRASPRVKIKKSLYLKKYESERSKSCMFLNSFQRAFLWKSLREFNFCILHTYP